MATIRDIAQQAGVTVTTVSRVLNNRGYIGESTRAKVMAAMEALDYKPNEVARSLLRRRTNLLGLIVPDVAHPFFAELVSRIERHAHGSGYKVLLCNAQMEPEKERGYIAMLRSHQVDGILMGSHTLETGDYLRLGLPLVTLERQIDPSIPHVASDNAEGGRLAADRLLAAGCRHPACISGDRSLGMLSDARYDAFLQAVTAAGCPCATLALADDMTGRNPEDGRIALFLEAHPEIDGIFCGSDLIAWSVLRACGRMGLQVPDRVRIIGYDDSLAASLGPLQLTTIRQEVDAMAEACVSCLVAQIEGREAPMATVLPVSLIVRDTA